MTTKMSSKGQIVLPAELRRRDDIRVGEWFEIERIDAGEYRLTKASRRPNAGLVDLLLACPVKGAIARLDRTETTDDVPLAVRP